MTAFTCLLGKLEETLKEMEIIVSNKDAELESCNTQLNQREVSNKLVCRILSPIMYYLQCKY